MTEEIPDHIKQAFHKAESGDIVEKLVAWGRLEKAGLAKQYMVGSRFMHLSLTAEGQRLKELCRCG